ncbi:unnamed protein product, partial [Vitis vinifera]|uniref:Uncharacterized protein n=1 Tax=Vitis vinifera TaxID=29760 RepID=D7TM52_VITVI
MVERYCFKLQASIQVKTFLFLFFSRTINFP